MNKLIIEWLESSKSGIDIINTDLDSYFYGKMKVHIQEGNDKQTIFRAYFYSLLKLAVVADEPKLVNAIGCCNNCKKNAYNLYKELSDLWKKHATNVSIDED